MAKLFIPALLESLYMVFASTFFSLVIGFPLGVLLLITERGGIWEKPLFNKVLGGVINIFRSIPFIILMILVFPISRFIVGTTIGTTASIVPLSISAAPFVARVMEGSLKAASKGVIESSLAMGATVAEIVSKVLIPESLPSIVSGITLTIINLIGYSAMAGAIGGGGLGNLAIRFGLHSRKPDIMTVAIIAIIILVQGVQLLGNSISKKINKK